MTFVQNHKVVAIHQPNYFPWLGFFSKIKQADAFVFLDTVDISLNSSMAITHRTKINYFGKPLWLTIPLEKSKSKEISFLKIKNNDEWKKKQLQIISQAYAKSPYFKETVQLFKELIFCGEVSLSKFNANIIIQLANYLNIKTEFYFASELGIHEKDATLRLVKICQKLDGNVYLSGMGGKKYHNENLFAENGIEVKYSAFVAQEYQHHSAFVHGLSLLDALFECGTETKTLL